MYISWNLRKSKCLSHLGCKTCVNKTTTNMITTITNIFCETGTRKEAHITHVEKELKCCLEETRPLTDVAETKILLWLLVFVVDVSTPRTKENIIFCTRFFTTCNTLPFLRRVYFPFSLLLLALLIAISLFFGVLSTTFYEDFRFQIRLNILR